MSEGDEDFGSMGGLQAMGILNALRTGDARVDMILAMCFPFVIRFLFATFKRFEDVFTLDYWLKVFRKEEKMHQRCIVYRSKQNVWGGTTDLDGDAQNMVLQKAIKLYLLSQVKLKLDSADTILTTIGSSVGQRYYGYHDHDDDGSSRTIVGMLSKYKIVQSPPHHAWHSLGSYGTAGAHVSLQISYVEQHDNGEGRARSSSSTVEFQFKSTDGAAIDDFVNKAYEWYMKELKKTEDHSRYLYELKSDLLSSTNRNNDEEGGSQHGGRVYKRYRLSDEKTFDSLFFAEKDPLLSLIQHFLDRSGKYAIQGYPHKLGLLLHGPPGSGKTSLIKALAHHTGRSVINVPLARISTNAELMSAFFDKNLRVEGESLAVRLRFKDVIFVIEDVDAASKIVKRRDGKKTADIVQTDEILIPDNKPIWNMMVESKDPDTQALVDLLMEKSPRLREEALRPDILISAAARLTAFPGLSAIGESSDHPGMRELANDVLKEANDAIRRQERTDRVLGFHAKSISRLLKAGSEVCEAFENELLGLSPPSIPALLPLSRTRQVSFTSYGGGNEVHVEDGGFGAKDDDMDSSMAKKRGSESGVSASKWFKDLDELNLQGLLNVLDGVVDSPGRIVIMTTNHPEHLDPALIRPGRIDKKLYLGFLSAKDMIAMIEHYFQVQLTEKQRRRVERAVAGTPLESRSRLRLTPAQVEQMTAEHDEVENMIKALEQRGRPLVPRSGLRVGFEKSELAFDV